MNENAQLKWGKLLKWQMWSNQTITFLIAFGCRDCVIKSFIHSFTHSFFHSFGTRKIIELNMGTSEL